MNITTLCVHCKKNNSCTRCWKTSNKECPYFNQKTNADRIRAMSDEELKKFICSMFKCEFCDFELGERCGLLNWLQMPAEEADNGKTD